MSLGDGGRIGKHAQPHTATFSPGMGSGRDPPPQHVPRTPGAGVRRDGSTGGCSGCAHRGGEGSEGETSGSVGSLSREGEEEEGV